MKRLILMLAAMAVGVVAYAQTSQSDTLKSLKPQAQTFTTELNVNPFNGQVNLNNSLNQIKVRYFATPNLAIRFGFNVSKIDSATNISNPYGTASYFSKNERHASTVGFNVGIEKHFKGTRRLSPYIGADISYTSKSANQTITDNQSTVKVENAWYYTYYSNTTLLSSVSQVGYTRYGLNLFTGFDFYLAEHFFIGYEFNYNIGKTNWKNVTITSTNTNTTLNNVNNQGKNTTTNFGPTLINGIRLGYSF